MRWHTSGFVRWFQSCWTVGPRGTGSPIFYLSESLSAVLESGLSASDPVAFVNAN
jgi:hypothetical protein